MELKEMVMMTLSELDEEKKDQEPTEPDDIKTSYETSMVRESEGPVDAGEKQFYENIREKLLVIFEGFQAPNNQNLESKIDLTLNFLEYLLARIDERLDNLNTAEK